jgi:hypothetical protein
MLRKNKGFSYRDLHVAFNGTNRYGADEGRISGCGTIAPGKPVSQGDIDKGALHLLAVGEAAVHQTSDQSLAAKSAGLCG